MPYGLDPDQDRRSVTPDLVPDVCMLGNCLCFCCRQLFFFNYFFSKEILSKRFRSIKRFGSRSGPSLCQPNPGSNCLHSE